MLDPTTHKKQNLKVYYTSDLHLEFLTVDDVLDLSKELREQLANDCVLILAGDIVNLAEEHLSGYTRFHALMRYIYPKVKAIVYSIGNHEYYSKPPHNSYKSVDGFVSTYANITRELTEHYTKLHISSLTYVPQVLSLDAYDISIINLADWYTLRPDWLVRPKISDSKHIAGLHMYEELCSGLTSIRDSQLEWVRSNRGTLNSDLVIVGHYLPSSLCINSRYIGSPVQDYFHVDKQDFLLDINPRYYIHGHTHHPVNVQFENTTILSNPKGYPGEFVRDFTPMKVEIKQK